MKYRYLAIIGIAAAITSALVAQEGAGRVPRSGPGATGGPAYKAPRLSDGTPDLQGTWDLSTATPLQRPAAYGSKAFLDDEELKKLTEDAEDRIATRNDPTAPTEPAAEAESVGTHDAVWLETSTRFTGRTSLITDPPDGRISPLTEEARKVRAARASKAAAQLNSGIYGSWEDLGTR